jgi:hypothetical protein
VGRQRTEVHDPYVPLRRLRLLQLFGCGDHVESLGGPTPPTSLLAASPPVKGPACVWLWAPAGA